jgi:hypothetical protein
MKTCYEPFCLGVNTRIAIAQQHMAMLETESNIAYKFTINYLAAAITDSVSTMSWQALGRWLLALG